MLRGFARRSEIKGKIEKTRRSAHLSPNRFAQDKWIERETQPAKKGPRTIQIDACKLGPSWLSREKHACGNRGRNNAMVLTFDNTHLSNPTMDRWPSSKARN